MTLIKLIRHGQITLPAQFRKELDLQDGDYLEAEIEDDKIILKPKVVLDRDAAIAKLHEIMDKARSRNKKVSGKEIERDIAEAIRGVRAQKRNDKRRP